MSYRTILAAPSVGMIHGTYGDEHIALRDRIANNESFPHEVVVRVPRRFVRDETGRYYLSRSNLLAAIRWRIDGKVA